MKADETTAPPTHRDPEQTVRSVRERYGTIARTGSGCCPPQAGCCGGGPEQLIALGIGYTPVDYLAATGGEDPAELRELMTAAGLTTADIAGVVHSVTFRAIKSAADARAER